MEKRHNNGTSDPVAVYTIAKWFGFICAYCIFTAILFFVQKKGLSGSELDLLTVFLLTSALLVLAKLISNLLAE